jgi:uncharacterized membrane protein YfcA
MLELFIYIIFGLVSGFALGTTSFNPVGLILLALNVLGIGDYKSNLGSLMILNLFPITIGSVYEFYKANKINWLLAITLIISVTLGSYFGSKLVTNKKYSLSDKTIKYFTAYICLAMGFVFLISAFYEKS